jgi:regulator of protease activity HflC (stomatin/prohibitin superfamily)
VLNGRSAKLLIALIAGVMSGCAYTTIEPGHVGIKIEQTGHQRGVQDFPIKTGRVWYNPVNENVLDFNTAIQQYTWTQNVNEGNAANEEMCFKSSDFLTFCADVNAAFKVIPDKAPSFYIQFRSDDMKVFVHGFFRNVIRDDLTKFAGNYSADDLNGKGQEEFLESATQAAKAELLTYGVDLIKLGFAHPPRPPEQIQKAINNKLEAVQNAIRVENELRQSEAEAKKMIAEAEGKAKANQVEMQSITPQLLQMRAIEKWNGTLPQAIGGSGAIPFIQIQGGGK